MTSIRWMIRQDMPSVLEIERQSFDNPWTEDDFIRHLRQRNCIGLVIENGDEIIGFVLYELHSQRLHILNLAVARNSRRCGVGKALIERLTGKLSQNGRNRLMLEVRETNLGAQLFFRSLGFRAISVLYGLYGDTDEDAYLMQYRCAQAVTRFEAAQ